MPDTSLAKPIGGPPPIRFLAGAILALFASVATLLIASFASCGSSPAPATPSLSAAPSTATIPLTSLRGVSAQPTIRVRIAAAATSIRLGMSNQPPTGGVATLAVSAPGGPPLAANLSPPVLVSRDAAGWLLSDARGTPHRFPADELHFAAPAAPGRTLLLDGTPYPGSLRLVPRSDLSAPAFDAIEHVPLEDYLPGVVAREMYANWPRTAYMVQAVCARSYALHEMLRAQASHRRHDVEATSRDQAYAGAASFPAAAAAVRDTRGVVLAADGLVLRAYYSSTCGGRTIGAADIWPTSAGYEYNTPVPIQAHPREALCNASPLFTWRLERSADELARRLRAYGAATGLLVRNLQALDSVEVLSVAATGRPAEYKLAEPGGRWFRLRAEDLRLACNFPAPGLPAITSKQRVPSGDLAIAFSPPFPGAAGPAPGGRGRIAVITGRGFGHGVGMCQYCARAMAARGDDWKAMLARFYPGAQLLRAYKD